MSHVYDRPREKNLILQVDRFCFSTLSIFSKPFSFWGVEYLLKYYLALFVMVAPVEAITEQKKKKLTPMGHFFLISQLTMVTKKMLHNSAANTD